MKNKSILKIILIVPCLFCSFLWSCQETKTPEDKKKSALLYGTIKWHIKEFAKAENLYPIGTGGSIPKKVENFAIMYQSSAKMTVPEVRRLILKLNNALIEKVNSNPENAPLLSQFPIGPKESSISLSFNDVNGGKHPLPYVSFAYTGRGEIIYDKIYKDLYRFEEMHRESFEEAQRIVNEEQGLK